VIERCLANADLPLSEVYHPLLNISRTLNIWSRQRGHMTIALRSFHDYSILFEDECFEVIGFTFRGETTDSRGALHRTRPHRLILARFLASVFPLQM